VITGPVLSCPYASEIGVVRLKGRICVMSGGHDVERDEHRQNNQFPHARDLREYVRAMFDYDFMQNVFEAATVVAIVLGLARGLMYATEFRLAGCSLREYEGRRVGLEHAPSPARP
jgi:hypothetical protein